MLHTLMASSAYMIIAEKQCTCTDKTSSKNQ